MAEELMGEVEYTTVQLRTDLHKDMRLLALLRDNKVKTEVENAVVEYLERNARSMPVRPQAVAQ